MAACDPADDLHRVHRHQIGVEIAEAKQPLELERGIAESSAASTSAADRHRATSSAAAKLAGLAERLTEPR